jgi:DNA-binding NtrC family response regulator
MLREVGYRDKLSELSSEKLLFMTKRVLIVEDEALIRYVLAQEIEELGWKVIEAATADEGIAILDKGMSSTFF